VRLALLDEADQFEAIDVGHVDVGDDQIPRAAWQQPEGVEAALRLGDFEADRARRRTPERYARKARMLAESSTSNTGALPVSIPSGHFSSAFVVDVSFAPGPPPNDAIATPCAPTAVIGAGSSGLTC